jgi:hypothetical protein
MAPRFEGWVHRPPKVGDVDGALTPSASCARSPPQRWRPRASYSSFTGRSTSRIGYCDRPRSRRHDLEGAHGATVQADPRVAGWACTATASAIAKFSDRLRSGSPGRGRSLPAGATCARRATRWSWWCRGGSSHDATTDERRSAWRWRCGRSPGSRRRWCGPRSAPGRGARRRVGARWGGGRRRSPPAPGRGAAQLPGSMPARRRPAQRRSPRGGRQPGRRGRSGHKPTQAEPH